MPHAPPEPVASPPRPARDLNPYRVSAPVSIPEPSPTLPPVLSYVRPKPSSPPTIRSSRPHSQNPYAAAMNPIDNESPSPYSDTYNPNSHNPYLSHLTPTAQLIHEEPDSLNDLPPSPNSLRDRNPYRHASTTSEDNEIPDPTEPSAKALGKLRRFSGLIGTDAEERQKQLEEQLRQKYLQAAEEKKGKSPSPNLSVEGRTNGSLNPYGNGYS